MATTTQIFLNDVDDITPFVVEIPPIIQSKAEYGQVITNDISSFQGNDSSYFWDLRSPSSGFFGQPDLSVNKITIYQDGVRAYVGYVRNIVPNNEDDSAEITLRSPLQALMESGVRLVSDTISNPAEIVRLLATYYGVEIDARSFGVSSDLYSDFNFQISVNLSLAEMSGEQLLMEMAEKGLARIYALNGTLYFEAYDPDYLVDSTYTFSDAIDNPDGCTIVQGVETFQIEKEKIFGYSVETLQGTTNFGDQTRAMKTVSGAGDAPVHIISAATGILIGDRWFEYLNRTDFQLTMGIPASLGRALTLAERVTVRNTQRHWADIVTAITGLDNSDDTQTVLTGVFHD